MAVRASDRVTLAVITSPTSVVTYYRKQASALAPPAKPTTSTPTGWTTTEPAYSPGTTDTLYTVQRTGWGDGSFQYGDVQQSSSFEAAKQAYNLASATALQAEARAKLDPMNLIDMTPVLLKDKTLWRATRRTWSVDGSGNLVYGAATSVVPNITEWFNDGFTITATGKEEIEILNPGNFTFTAHMNADPKMTVSSTGSVPWGSNTATGLWNGTMFGVAGQMYSADGTPLIISQDNGVIAREPIETPEEWAVHGGGQAGATIVRGSGITVNGVTHPTAHWTPKLIIRFRAAGESITIRNLFVRASDPINWSAVAVPLESVEGLPEVRDEQALLTTKSTTETTNLFDVTPLVLKNESGFIVEYEAVLVDGVWVWKEVSNPTFTVTSWYPDGFDISIPAGRAVKIGGLRPIPNTSPVFVTGQMRITSTLPTGATVGLHQQGFSANGTPVSSIAEQGPELFSGVWVTGTNTVPGALSNTTPGLAVSKSGQTDAPPFITHPLASWTPAVTMLPTSRTATSPLNVSIRDIRMTSAPIPAPHAHTIADVAGLATELQSKASSSHSHTGAQVTQATDVARGTVELATTAEATAGIDTTRAVTPAGVQAAITSNASLPYAEFTTNKAFANGAVTPVGNFTRDTSVTNNNSFAVPQADGVLRLLPGNYAIRTNQNIGFDSATGRSFVDIEQWNGSAWATLGRWAIPVGEDRVAGSLPGLRLTATTDIRFVCYRNIFAPGNQLFSRVAVTRIGDV